jgi:lysozyme family protein
MGDRFEAVHADTARWEGGWSDHPADPGGKTMYGITQAVYHDWLKGQGRPIRPVRDITRGEALQIYRAQYWNPTAVRYNLFPGVDRATYDAAVNSGVSRGIKWLKGAVGSDDHSETAKRICRARLSFVQGLTNWKVFGKGWGNRIADIEAKSVRDALQAMARPPETVNDRLEAERAQAAAEERKKANQAKTAGGSSAASGAGATQTDTVVPDQAGDLVLGMAPDQLAAVVLIGIMAIAAIAAVAFVIRKRQAAARERAYAAELQEAKR